MSSLIEGIKAKAKANKQHILLPEGEEERILRATDILLRRQIADIILLGDVDAIKAKISLDKVGDALGGLKGLFGK